MTWSGNTYGAAAQYLQGGRYKNVRTISANKFLRRNDDGSISLVLHSTAVVTYHEDGGVTLYLGGWNTVTTKRVISDYSPHRIGSSYSRKFPGLVLGYSGELTPPRVQKCRTCKGEGGWVHRKECSGPPTSTWQGGYKSLTCSGPRTEHRLPSPYSAEGKEQGITWQDYSDSAYTVPCEHGAQFDGYHNPNLCAHGQRKRHRHGEVFTVECSRCGGAGVVDYGSERIPIIWTDHHAAVRYDTNGNLVDTDAKVYDGYRPAGTTVKGTKKGGKKKAGWYDTYTPPAQVAYNGVSINDTLQSLIPTMRSTVKCPACDHHYESVTDIVMHLNDTMGYTREAVADWLDTLDLDLRFPHDDKEQA